MTLLEKIVRIGQALRVDRVRGGKVQRKKLKAARKGFKISGSKVVRMKPGERRRRRLAGRKTARRRSAKLSSILRKRKISIARGKRSGIYRK